MKITGFKASNFKRIEVAEITPAGNMVKISGKNRAGKTSILDAIYCTLTGKASVPDEPLRRGAKRGASQVMIGDKYIAERTFSKKSGTQLKLTTAEGVKVSKPQQILDDLVGNLSFDPLAFQRMTSRQQADTLRELTGVDTTILDREYDRTFAERTPVNSRAKSLTARLAAVPVPDAAPAEVSVSALAEELEAAGELNRENGASRELLEEMREQAHADSAALDAAKAKIEAFELKRDEAADRLAQIEADIEGQTSIVEGLEDIDTAPIRERMATAEESNAEHRRATEAHAERDRLQAELTEASDEAEAMTERLDALREQRIEMIAAADMPLDGLSFSDDGEVSYNGLPLDQASSAEQLMVSLAMGGALNPELRVLFVRDGSLLDSESMGIVETWAEGEDYQVWCELVDETGDIGIVIEDGQVAKVNEAAS